MDQTVKKFIHQTLGTSLENIIVDPLPDRLRIKVPEGNIHLLQVTQVLKPRLDNAYYTSIGNNYVELFEPPENAEAAGRAQCSGHDIMVAIAARVASEEAAMLQSIKDALPGASEDFRTGLKAIVQGLEPDEPKPFIGSAGTPRLQP